MSTAHAHAAETMVGAVIVLNSAVMLWGIIDPAHDELAGRIEVGCLVFFACEVAARMWGGGWRRPWVVFDTLVVMAALLPVLPINATAVRLVRLLRIAHLGRHSIGHLQLARFGYRCKAPSMTSTEAYTAQSSLGGHSFWLACHATQGDVMNNTIKLVAVCVAAPVMALGVAAPTAWAETGTGHSHTNGGPIVDHHNGDPVVDHHNGGPVVNHIFVPPQVFVPPPAEHHAPNIGFETTLPS
jgi:hypothetical protein